MRKRQLRVVLLALFAAGSVLTATSPVWARCEGWCTGFTRDEYEVVEATGYVDIQVSQAWGPPADQGQIDYKTSDLTAVAGQDYEQTSGTLIFTYESWGSEVIRIPITKDELFEDEERFEVTLTNFRGHFANRGRETTVVRIADDYPKPSSGISASSGRSNQQPTGSQESSLALPPSLHPAGPASSGSKDAGNQSGEVNPDDPTRMGRTGLGDEAKPFAGKSVPDADRPSSLPLAGLGTLLLVTIAVVGFGLKKRFGRRLT